MSDDTKLSSANLFPHFALRVSPTPHSKRGTANAAMTDGCSQT